MKLKRDSYKVNQYLSLIPISNGDIDKAILIIQEVCMAHPDFSDVRSNVEIQYFP